jgi:hypothetical protein
MAMRPSPFHAERLVSAAERQSHTDQTVHINKRMNAMTANIPP